MSEAVKRFNGLSGMVDRATVKKILIIAEAEGQNTLARRLEAALREGKKYDTVIFNPGPLALEEIPSCDLPGIDQVPPYISAEDYHGLNKAVSPDEIYQYITDLMLKRIEEAGSLPWHQMWEDKLNFKTYKNFDTKKPYRGINFFLLNLDFFGAIVERENPYFLTFKQIEKHGGQLRKGATGVKIVYFTRLFSYTQEEPKLSFATYNEKKFDEWIEKNKTKIPERQQKLSHAIPILKYYNVFSGEDVTGIDFGDFPKTPTQERSEEEKIAAAENIIEHYPNPPKIKFAGNQPAYYPGYDEIRMTPLEQFKQPEYFYSVFFHELTHSTGHSKRLDRGNDTRRRDGGAKDKKAYDFEELVAEMGSVFLCAESGILFHTRDQSAIYLDHYIKKLKARMKEDNRFFFRAASASQAAADYILDRDKNGVPAYQNKNTTPADTAEKTVPRSTEKKEVLAKGEKKSTHRFTKGQTVQLSKRWGKTQPGTEGTVKELRKSAHGDPMYSVTIGKDLLFFPETVLQLPKKKLSKEELEKANPEPKAVKPKSVSVASAIEDILALDKFKGISKIQANILYKYFKNDVGNLDFDADGFSKKYYDISGFEYGNMKKDTDFHFLFPGIDDEAPLSITERGEELVNSINNRVESKKNQKHNYALFDGLHGTKSKKTVTGKRKTVTKKTKSGLKSPTTEIIEPKTTAGENSIGGRCRPLISGKRSPIKFKKPDQKNPLFPVVGETRRFFGKIEKKPIHSVVITLDTEKGVGKTTSVYTFLNDFHAAGNKCMFASLEEHPSSNLAIEKAEKYFSGAAREEIDAFSEFKNIQELLATIQHYDVIAIDSWQKLVRMLGPIYLDEQLRMAFNGKLFLIVFQQRGDGKTKGGSDIEFDGDIITKGYKGASFGENYLYFDKNRYTEYPIENLKYFVGNQKTYIEGETIAEVPPQNEVLASTAEKEETYNFIMN